MNIDYIGKQNFCCLINWIFIGYCLIYWILNFNLGSNFIFIYIVIMEFYELKVVENCLKFYIVYIILETNVTFKSSIFIYV